MKEYKLKFDNWTDFYLFFDKINDTQLVREDECVRLSTVVRSTKKEDSFILFIPRHEQITELETMEVKNDE